VPHLNAETDEEERKTDGVAFNTSILLRNELLQKIAAFQKVYNLYFKTVI
jgi:hypothetical protein